MVDRRNRQDLGLRMRDRDICDRVMLELSAQDYILFRNNVGAFRTESGGYVRYGVCNPGGSDLIGFRSIIVTPEMVGQRLAVFTAIEAKTARMKLSDDQRRFLAAVSRAGGIAEQARETPAGIKRIKFECMGK